ncbi:uncharacterized protein LOC143035073 isoform X2 [Oratosquilla oratoria]|uniref:uncharacterized protein LOC143035073 isoform X2 n=1 Tax=Oratosquilla oratoria TaxID=337810 RepID=UPI003F765CA1
MSQTRGRPRRASNPRTRSRSPRVKGDGGIMNEEEFLLKWNNHQTNFVDVFRELLGQSSFIDVSLVCGGEVFPAHKVILAACSPLLHNLFKENPCQHPVVILNDVPARDMKAMMKFIYQGEVSVSQTELASFLKTADNLQIKGLAEDREKDREREERKRKEKDSDAKSEGRVNKRQRTSDHNSNRELASAQSNKAHKESYSSHNKNKSSSRNTSEDRLCNSIAQYGIQPSVGIRTIPPPHPTHPPTGNENDSSSANSQSVPPTSQAHSIPPKEETLMIKTEPFLDYHGEMVWQEGSEELDGNTQGPETINASEGLPLTDGHADSQVPAGMQEGQEGMPAPEMGEGGKYAEDMRGDANANNNDDPSHTAPATGSCGALQAGLRFVLHSSSTRNKYKPFSTSIAAGGGEGGEGEGGEGDEGGGETGGGGGSPRYVTLDDWRDAAQGFDLDQAAYDLQDASLSLLGVATTPALRSKYRMASGGSSRGGGRGRLGSCRYRRGSKIQASGTRGAATGEETLDGTSVGGGGDRLEEMVVMHGECVAGDWRCKLCGLRFPKRSKLVRHFTRHTNVRQFGCPLCPGHYKRKDHLRHHMRTKHPITDIMSGAVVHYSG